MDHRHPRRIDQIEPGFYRYRRVKGGAWMPAEVSIEGGMIFVVEADTLRVGIKLTDYEDLVVEAIVYGKAFAEPLLRVLWFGEPISEREHNRMMGILGWARVHMPDHPMLRPDEPIVLSEVRVHHLF